jgi:hypothetical protein
MHKLSIAVFTLALCAMVVAGVGCMKCGESIAEKATEKAVEAASGGKVKVDAGVTDMSDLPGFLRYPGVKAVGKMSVATEEGHGTVWSLESGDLIGNIVDWYRAALKTQGWKTGAEVQTGKGTMLVGASADEKETVSILLSWGEDKTTISLTHVRK